MNFRSWQKRDTFPFVNARPRILILHASGTNRDHDAAAACELAGGAPEIVHVNQLRAGERRWSDYQMLVLPGGFSYGDALGAGRLVALDLNVYFADEVRAFVESGKLVLGICNGFQALVKAGILPGLEADGAMQQATLARNARGRFECRWVTLIPNPASPCLFTRGLSEPIYCPVAHGEGNFIPRDAAVLAMLQARGQIALTYGNQTVSDSDRAPVTYPDNPNGSVADIAGICNPRGNVLGLMPHPENHIYPWQHPRWTRGERGGLGLALFKSAVRVLAAGV
ncbi:MAG: phosphoribosylformylglycinamidine synthase subunit PurQ [Candidatus Roseilinea sp.]|nr:MAG: phosphoribosylformylglycinamidine synthase subunit PurQ [Candidatus Roseilinea sp.]